MTRYADFLLGLKPLYLSTVLAIKRAFPWKVQAGSNTALKWLDRGYAPEGRRGERTKSVRCS